MGERIIEVFSFSLSLSSPFLFFPSSSFIIFSLQSFYPFLLFFLLTPSTVIAPSLISTHPIAHLCILLILIHNKKRRQRHPSRFSTVIAVSPPSVHPGPSWPLHISNLLSALSTLFIASFFCVDPSLLPSFLTAIPPLLPSVPPFLRLHSPFSRLLLCVDVSPLSTALSCCVVHSLAVFAIGLVCPCLIVVFFPHEKKKRSPEPASTAWESLDRPFPFPWRPCLYHQPPFGPFSSFFHFFLFSPFTFAPLPRHCPSRLNRGHGVNAEHNLFSSLSE